MVKYAPIKYFLEEVKKLAEKSGEQVLMVNVERLRAEQATPFPSASTILISTQEADQVGGSKVVSRTGRYAFPEDSLEQAVADWEKAGFVRVTPVLPEEDSVVK